jgi:KDO2-lipid IV(A) lauroyltransferase
VTAIALRAIAALVSLLPWRATTPLGRTLGFLAGSVLRIRRSHVEASLARIGARGAAAMYASLGIGVFELLWLAGASKARRDAVLDRHVRLDVIPDGPIVFCASHTGNWELAAAAAARVRPLFVVAKPFTSSGFDAFVARLRDLLGVRTIHPDGAMKAALAALADGAIVVMPIDQVPDRRARAHVDRAPFLGADAHVDRAPFVVARRAKAKALVTVARRDGTRHEVRILGAADGPAAATAVLDRFVRAHPECWMWLHRRWRRPVDRLEKAAWTTPSSSPDRTASRAA